MTDQSLDDSGSKDGARLLVVDDEESVAFTVSEVLRLDGFVVDTALSGDEAIVRLKNCNYDLVLTDLHMQDGDGISVLTEVRKCDSPTIAIVLTGFASLESAIAAMRQGAYDYLIKPCIIDDMKHTIQRGLDHRRLILAERDARANLEQLNRELERRVEERTRELQRVNDELANANRAKDVFFATLSHELRTPLTPILGWAKLLRNSQEPHLVTQGLEAIERNAQLQTRLIDDLLDVSRIVSGKLSFDKEPTDLCAVVRAAAETVRERANSRGVELRIETPPTPLIVQGAPVRLQQIVWNLLSNAIKFTDHGGRVSVEVTRARATARVVVTDTGAGISKEFLPHVFDLFRQADSSYTRSHGGLGLGLAIVRRLTELHEGHVRAESEGPGMGSRFILSLPCDVGVPPTEEDEEVRLHFNLQSPVLVVEDSPDTLDLLCAFFIQKGCRVLTASSAVEALEVAANEPLGLIVSDIGMPDADGYELIARLRLQPGLANVPAIAISGFAMEEDNARALAAGFTAHIAKPVDPERLFTLIQELTS